MKMESIQALWQNASYERMDQVIALGQRMAQGWSDQGVVRCVVFQISETEVLSALYAAACTGVDLILPAHLDKDTMQAIDLDASDVLLDSEVKFSEWPEVKSARVPNQDFKVTFFTSGSTGEPKAITRPFSRLLLEVETLEKTWGSSIPKGALFTGTVSYQHIYGFLFKVMWPLASQRSMSPQGVKFEESLAQISQFNPSLVLISSPAFLKRIHEPTDTHDTPMVVFSSGGLLTDEEQSKAESLLGHAIIQVYGSTETGGIAHRSHGQLWQPFEGVACHSNAGGELRVRSVHCYLDDWINTHDQVEWSGKQFILKGRTDRIVKIEEKRVSLDQVERMICTIPNIQTCRVFVMTTSRQALAAVICLKNPLPEASHKTKKQEIKNALKTQVETLAIPKYIRFVDQMPVNEQGKTTTQALKACFQ